MPRTDAAYMFVTHDINEALKLGTKLLVMNEGEVVQYAPPEELRSRPADAFVEKLLSPTEFAASGKNPH